MIRLALTLCLFTLMNGSIKAGGEQCFSIFECLNTCPWESGDLETPKVIYRYFIPSLNTWDGWYNTANANANCGDTSFYGNPNPCDQVQKMLQTIVIVILGILLIGDPGATPARSPVVIPKLVVD